LYSAGVKKLGTDESTFNAILASQSYEQLRCVFDEYRKISPQDIEQSIKNEMSGNLEIGMLAVGQYVAMVIEKILIVFKEQNVLV